MYIWVCFLCGKTVYNLLGTTQYVVVSGSDDISKGRPPTTEEMKEIAYHNWYMSQLLGGRYGS
jgi:hypothetical protein